MTAGTRKHLTAAEDDHGGEDLQSRIDRIAARLERLTQAGRDRPPSAAAPTTAETLYQRLEALDRRYTATAMSAPADVSPPAASASLPSVSAPTVPGASVGVIAAATASPEIKSPAIAAAAIPTPPAIVALAPAATPQALPAGVASPVAGLAAKTAAAPEFGFPRLPAASPPAPPAARPVHPLLSTPAVPSMPAPAATPVSWATATAMRAEPAPADAAAALSDVAAALRALDAHGPARVAPAAAAAPIVVPPVVAEPARAEAPAGLSLTEISRRRDAASAARWAALIAEPPRAASLSSAAAGDDPESRAARRLANLTGRTAGGGAVPSPAAPASSRLDAAIAEIAERQKAIDSQARPAGPALTALRAADETEGLGTVLGDLRADVAALTRTTSGLDALTRRQRESIEALGGRVGSLDATQGMDRREIATLRDELAGLRQALDETARESSLKTMEAGYGHIVERLDEVARNAAAASRLEELAAELFGRLPAADRLEQIGADVKRLSESGGGPEALSRLEARLDHFEAGIAGATAEGARPMADSVRRLEEGVAETRAAVAGLRSEVTAPHPALTRLESRIDDVAGRLEEALARAPRAEAVDQLVARLETVVGRLDARGPGDPAPSEALLQALAEELSETRRMVAERAPPADTTAVRSLEEQMRQLAERLDQVGPGQAGQSALDQLELQVAALTVKLDDLTAVPEAFAEVGKGLARLESIISGNPGLSPDDVRKVARETMVELTAEQRATADTERALIAGLQDDLRRLQSAGRDGEARNADSIGSVQGALERIATRLETLEAGARALAALPVVAPPPVQTSGRDLLPPAGLPPAGEYVASTPRGEPARTETFDENRLLAPGSGRPVADDGTRDRKADFIAAARRAAQAAAAESGAFDPAKPASADKPGPLSRFTQVFRNRRRPLLLAAAAVLLTIAVVRVLGPIGLNGQAVARAPQPDVTPPSSDIPAPALAASAAVPASLVTPQAATMPPTAAPSAAVIQTPAPPRVATARPPEAPRPVAGQATNVGQPPAALVPPAPVPSPLAFAPPDATAANFAQAFAAAGVGEPASPAATRAFAPLGEAAAVPMPDEEVGPLRLRVAAAGGDPGALFEVASRYAEGRGVDADSREAAVWYERAAERGLAVAQFRVAAFYERGQGVTADRAKALSWYERAAEQGHVQAMHNLAVLYSEGVGGTPDYAAATRWFALAAEHGVRDSQYNLGVISARGIGSAQDLEASYRWFALAAAQGDADAAARRDDVGGALSAERLALARAAVAAFAPKPADEAANTVRVPDGGWDGADSRVTEADRLELVKRIQSLLAENGFDPGPADGFVGPKTREAARAFQAARGLTVDGSLDGVLLAALANPG